MFTNFLLLVTHIEIMDQNLMLQSCCQKDSLAPCTMQTTSCQYVPINKLRCSTFSSAASSGGSGSSGPSSIESVQRNSNNSGLYDKTLVVIEKSNKELEKNLTLASEVNVTSLQQPQQQPQTQVWIL